MITPGVTNAVEITRNIGIGELRESKNLRELLKEKPLSIRLLQNMFPELDQHLFT
jgi:hypothetical protein